MCAWLLCDTMEVGVQRHCPAGRYGASYGMTSADCTGPCAAGYYCPLGSTSQYQVKCGGAAYYCPLGSAAPNPVTSGYYTRTFSFFESVVGTADELEEWWEWDLYL